MDFLALEYKNTNISGNNYFTDKVKDNWQLCPLFKYIIEDVLKILYECKLKLSFRMVEEGLATNDTTTHVQSLRPWRLTAAIKREAPTQF